jgi:hypothetical protein
MVKKQTRCKNQIKSILAFYGIHLPVDIVHCNWSSKFIHCIEELRMERASGDFVIKVHLHDQIRFEKPTGVCYLRLYNK